ncbi:MAG: flavodoxin family protein [Desulfobulbaceae bacterium A2]|nr:MAG: flavodoxin family protein [Desulfobulbaceae bacterium A2]
MKQLVVFSSTGGNTKKLAEAAFKHLQGEAEIHPVNQAPDPKGYDLVVVGFWFKGGQPDPASQEYLKRCAGARSLFLFASHGAAADSEHARYGMNAARELAAGAQIIGSFSCPGQVPAKVQETAAGKVPQPAWLKDAPAAAGHPDAEDLHQLLEAMRHAGI